MDLTECINCYLERGFGSLNKNDFEVFIFYWLLNNNQNCVSKSDFAISQFLKIPETKVKRLRYEAELKYSKLTADDLRQGLSEAIKTARCQEGPTEGKISLMIPNKILRQYLADMLINDGRVFDASFNPQVVTISAGSFLFILEQLFLSKEEKQEIIKEAQKHINTDGSMPSSVSDSLKKIGVIMGKVFLEKLIGASVDELGNVVKAFVNEVNEK